MVFGEIVHLYTTFWSKKFIKMSFDMSGSGELDSTVAAKPARRSEREIRYERPRPPPKHHHLNRSVVTLM